MKPSVAAAALGIAESTVRSWSNKYREFLSPSGAGGGGSHRDYTDHDLRVLKLVRDMKKGNVTDTDIDATLSSLRDGDWARLPTLDEDLRSIIPAPSALIAAQRDKEVFQREIELLCEQIEKLESQVSKNRDTIDDLTRRLTRAETMLELYETGRLKPKGE
jgi:DNA-binding transcriptional MerR regulator